jgi:hypothetical protein
MRRNETETPIMTVACGRGLFHRRGTVGAYLTALRSIQEIGSVPSVLTAVNTIKVS